MTQSEPLTPPENRIESYPYWPLHRFEPDFPDGRITHLYTHWSAHDYHKVFPAYHFCVAMAPGGEIVVVNTHGVRENMREVYNGPELPYAAHTRGRNSFAIGISVMAMQDARPENFGAFPLTETLIDALCRTGAAIVKRYGIALDAEHVMSHAEAAVLDGYFGTEPEQRWDIARLREDARPLEPSDAAAAGDDLRARMKRFV